MSAAAQILEQLRHQGVEPTGLCADSRQLRRGEVFVALPGSRSDGRAHVADAVAAGAAAVLWERQGQAPAAIAVPNIGVTGLAALSGELAKRVYGAPSQRLWMVGVTGTNGKTSVSLWIAQALSAAGRRCAVVGTLGSGYPGELQASPNTTPDAISLQRRLADFVAGGAQACAMEVSSIGLAEGRVAAVDFDLALFTNLSRDHLDYHPNMEAYAAAKAALFEAPGLSAAVLNLDDPRGREIAKMLAGKGVRRIGYTLDDAAAHADLVDEIVFAEALHFGSAGLGFRVRHGATMAEVVAPLLGRFNAANLLAVIGALLASGVHLDRAVAQLAHLSAPPGRMQAVPGSAHEPLLVVDYAHTPDALEQALTTLREVARARGGKLHCLFGCGGERDPGKRPLMGAVAERLADRVVVTSDNPRREAPAAIIDDILRGMATEPLVEPERASAIRLAVAGAAAPDVVLLAGKGHESYQEVADRRLPFSDLVEAGKALAARSSQP